MIANPEARCHTTRKVLPRHDETQTWRPSPVGIMEFGHGTLVCTGCVAGKLSRTTL